VGCPIRVGEWFDCSNNRLTSLVGCPRSVGDYFYCSCNNIREFTGIKYIGGQLWCAINPISNIWKVISPNEGWNEDHVIQDDGEAVAIERLNFFLQEIGLHPVEKVDGYINI